DDAEARPLRRIPRIKHVSRRLVFLALAALVLAGCAQGRTVVPVRMQQASFAVPTGSGTLDVSSHETTVRTVAAVIVRDVGLPLPETDRVRLLLATGLRAGADRRRSGVPRPGRGAERFRGRRRQATAAPAAP